MKSTTTTTIPPAPTEDWTESFRHSEVLDGLMALASALQELSPEFQKFLRIHVIVDTNIIYGDLYAMLRKERVGHRRPAVMELLAKRTLIGYFPREKLPELHSKCVELSDRYGLPLADVVALRNEYERHLVLVPTMDLERERADSQAIALRDPTDLTLAQARHIVGASVVLTNDPDIEASGVPVMPWSQVLLDLRHHARHEGVKAALFLAGGTVVLVPMIALIGCVKLMYEAGRRIPAKALLIAAAGLGIALIFPQSRKFLIDAGKSAFEGMKRAAAVIGPLISQATEAGTRAQTAAMQMRPALEEKLARALVKRLSLTQAVYRACLLATKPLSAEEIWRIAQRDGVVSKARNPLRSVVRALNRHPLIEPVGDRHWRAIPVPRGPASAS
jgi:hypothetical protein